MVPELESPRISYATKSPPLACGLRHPGSSGAVAERHPLFRPSPRGGSERIPPASAGLRAIKGGRSLRINQAPIAGRYSEVYLRARGSRAHPALRSIRVWVGAHSARARENCAGRSSLLRSARRTESKEDTKREDEGAYWIEVTGGSSHRAGACACAGHGCGRTLVSPSCGPFAYGVQAGAVRTGMEANE